MKSFLKSGLIGLIAAGSIGCIAPTDQRDPPGSGTVIDAAAPPSAAPRLAPGLVPGLVQDEVALPKVRSLKCELSGDEKYFLYIDGVLRGFLENYEVGNGNAILSKGIIPPGKFIQDWMDFNQTAPFLIEKHDVTIREIVDKKTLSPILVELQNANVQTVEASPAEDAPSCLIFESIVLRADLVILNPKKASP